MTNPIFRLYGGLSARVRALKFRFLQLFLDDMVQSLRMHFGPSTTNIGTLTSSNLPLQITGFHDLAFLFSAHQANRGIIAQDIDEAAYLWGLVVNKRPKEVIEIGRWLGGSTVLLAAAANRSGGKLVSIDLKVKAPDYADDKLIEDLLKKLGLSNVRMVVGNSRDFDPQVSVDLAFIDGDHSYEGAKQDFENLTRYMSPGADILFHDSCSTRRFATLHVEVARLMGELRRHPRLIFKREIGSITHFEWRGRV